MAVGQDRRGFVREAAVLVLLMGWIWSMPLRWTQVPWYMRQVSWRLVQEFKFVGGGDICTDTDSNISLLLLYFFQNKESKPREMSKINPTVACTECYHSRKCWKNVSPLKCLMSFHNHSTFPQILCMLGTKGLCNSKVKALKSHTFELPLQWTVGGHRGMLNSFHFRKQR
jgi:hypothetical protein